MRRPFIGIVDVFESKMSDKELIQTARIWLTEHFRAAKIKIGTEHIERLLLLANAGSQYNLNNPKAYSAPNHDPLGMFEGETINDELLEALKDARRIILALDKRTDSGLASGPNMKFINSIIAKAEATP